jgi:hypothetical protein
LINGILPLRARPGMLAVLDEAVYEAVVSLVRARLEKARSV